MGYIVKRKKEKKMCHIGTKSEYVSQADKDKQKALTGAKMVDGVMLFWY
jgi:hypothetical protein